MSSQVSAAPTTNHPQTSSKQTHQRNSSSRIERFLGIFGPKASGKTVYLTALYNLNIFSHEDESAFHLSVPDGHPTHSYLKRRWQQMAQQRQWIDATELRSPEEMLFHVTWQDPQGQTRDYRVVLPDACGELMDRAEEYSKTQRSNILQLQLKEDYFQQLKQSHGIALFIPGNLAAQSSEAAELKHAFDPLFDALKRERDQQGIKQPIAVIVTMWDLHSPYPQDRAQEEQKARDYIRSVLGHFVEDLEQLASKDFVKVFPISATGPLQPALPHSFAQTQHLPPPVQFRPYRIKAPVHWLLSAYEQLLLENSERAYEKAIQRPKLSQLTKLKTQINSSLQELAPSPQKERLEHISDQISDLVLALQKKSRRRKFFSTFVLLALLSSGVALWDKAFEKKAISIADQFLQDPKTTQMQRIETLKHLCLRRPLPTQSIFGCWQSITLKRTHVIQSGASAGWKELLPLPSEPSLSQLQARINELETFLQIYPNVPESTLARQQLAQAKGNFVQKRQAEQRLHWSRFLAQAQSAHTTVELEQATKTCHDQFLEKEEYIWMKLQISEACNRLRVKMRHQKEGTAVLSKLNEIKTKIAQDSQNTSLCIKETGDFLITYPRTQFSEEVKKIQDDCKKKEDEGYWNKQVALYKQENTTEYREIIKRAKEYLQNPQYKIYTQEARSLIQKTESEWDRSQYQQIQKNWQNNHSKLDAATIDRIHTKCEEYIANAPTKQMKAAVENWLRWHKKLRSGIQFNLVIEKIRIGTEWYSRLHWPDVVVSVKVGAEEKKSEEFVDLKVETEYSSNEDNHLVTKKQLPQTLGPFTWRYGSDDITVRMLNTEITQAYEKSQTAGEEKYNISFLQGQVAVQSGFYIHARIEPVSSEDRTPNSAIFPDYND